MNSKLKKVIKDKDKQEVVRIVIDKNLKINIIIMQKKYPLMSQSEIIKMFLSRGVISELGPIADDQKSYKPVVDFINDLNKKNLTIKDLKAEDDFLSSK
jgi:hypothetical protein